MNYVSTPLIVSSHGPVTAVALIPSIAGSSGAAGGRSWTPHPRGRLDDLLLVGTATGSVAVLESNQKQNNICPEQEHQRPQRAGYNGARAPPCHGNWQRWHEDDGGSGRPPPGCSSTEGAPPCEVVRIKAVGIEDEAKFCSISRMSVCVGRIEDDGRAALVLLFRVRLVDPPPGGAGGSPRWISDAACATSAAASSGAVVFYGTTSSSSSNSACREEEVGGRQAHQVQGELYYCRRLRFSVQKSVLCSEEAGSAISQVEINRSGTVLAYSVVFLPGRAWGRSAGVKLLSPVSFQKLGFVPLFKPSAHDGGFCAPGPGAASSIEQKLAFLPIGTTQGLENNSESSESGTQRQMLDKNANTDRLLITRHDYSGRQQAQAGPGAGAATTELSFFRPTSREIGGERIFRVDCEKRLDLGRGVFECGGVFEVSQSKPGLHYLSLFERRENRFCVVATAFDDASAAAPGTSSSSSVQEPGELQLHHRAFFLYDEAIGVPRYRRTPSPPRYGFLSPRILIESALSVPLEVEGTSDKDNGKENHQTKDPFAPRPNRISPTDVDFFDANAATKNKTTTAASRGSAMSVAVPRPKESRLLLPLLCVRRKRINELLDDHQKSSELAHAPSPGRSPTQTSAVDELDKSLSCSSSSSVAVAVQQRAQVGATLLNDGREQADRPRPPAHAPAEPHQGPQSLLSHEQQLQQLQPSSSATSSAADMLLVLHPTQIRASRFREVLGQMLLTAKQQEPEQAEPDSCCERAYVFFFQMLLKLVTERDAADVGQLQRRRSGAAVSVSSTEATPRPATSKSSAVAGVTLVAPLRPADLAQQLHLTKSTPSSPVRARVMPTSSTSAGRAREQEKLPTSRGKTIREAVSSDEPQDYQDEQVLDVDPCISLTSLLSASVLRQFTAASLRDLWFYISWRSKTESESSRPAGGVAGAAMEAMLQAATEGPLSSSGGGSSSGGCSASSGGGFLVLLEAFLGNAARLAELRAFLREIPTKYWPWLKHYLCRQLDEATATVRRNASSSGPTRRLSSMALAPRRGGAARRGGNQARAAPRHPSSQVLEDLFASTFLSSSSSFASTSTGTTKTGNVKVNDKNEQQQQPKDNDEQALVAEQDAKELGLAWRRVLLIDSLMFVLLSANTTLSDSCEAEISECNRERACLLLSDHADCTQVSTRVFSLLVRLVSNSNAGGNNNKPGKLPAAFRGGEHDPEDSSKSGDAATFTSSFLVQHHKVLFQLNPEKAIEVVLAASESEASPTGDVVSVENRTLASVLRSLYIASKAAPRKNLPAEETPFLAESCFWRLLKAAHFHRIQVAGEDSYTIKHKMLTDPEIFAAHCGSNPLGSFRLLSRYTTPATEDARTHAPPRDFATELEGAVFLRDEEPDDLDHEGHDEVDEKEVCVDFAAALSAWFGDGKLDAAIQHRIGSSTSLLQDDHFGTAPVHQQPGTSSRSHSRQSAGSLTTTGAARTGTTISGTTPSSTLVNHVSSRVIPLELNARLNLLPHRGEGKTKGSFRSVFPVAARALGDIEYMLRSLMLSTPKQRGQEYVEEEDEKLQDEHHLPGSGEADSDLLQDECLPSTSEPEEEEFLRFSTQTHLEHLPEALRYNCGSCTTRQQQLFLKSIRQRVRGCFFRLLDVVSLSGAAEDVQQKTTTPPTNYTLTSQLQLNLPTLLAQLAREQKKREHVAQESCDRAKREEDQWRRLGMKKIAISLGRSHAHWLHGVKNTAAGVLVDPSSFDLDGNQTNIDVEQGPLDRDPNQKRTTIRIPFSKLEKSHAALWNERASNV